MWLQRNLPVTRQLECKSACVFFFNYLPLTKRDKVPILHFLFQVYRWVVRGKSLMSGASCRLEAANVQIQSAVHHCGRLCALIISQHCLFEPSVSAPQGLWDVNVQDYSYCLMGLWWTLDIRISSDVVGTFKEPLVESFCLQKICECFSCHLLASRGIWTELFA